MIRLLTFVLLAPSFLFGATVRTVTFDDPCVPDATVIILPHIEDLWRGTERGTIAGYYWAPSMTIYLETDGRDPMWPTLLHEIEHHLDYQAGRCWTAGP